MQSQVQSDPILVADLKNQIESLWRTTERFARYLPPGEADVYLSGVLAGLLGIGEAHGLNMPALREAEHAIVQRRRVPTKYDMRL